MSLPGIMFTLSCRGIVPQFPQGTPTVKAARAQLTVGRQHATAYRVRQDGPDPDPVVTRGRPQGWKLGSRRPAASGSVRLSAGPRARSNDPRLIVITWRSSWVTATHITSSVPGSVNLQDPWRKSQTRVPSMAAVTTTSTHRRDRQDRGAVPGQHRGYRPARHVPDPDAVLAEGVHARGHQPTIWGHRSQMTPGEPDSTRATSLVDSETVNNRP